MADKKPVKDTRKTAMRVIMLIMAIIMAIGATIPFFLK